MPWLNSFSSYGNNIPLYISSVLIPAQFHYFLPLLPYHPSYLTSQNVPSSVLSWTQSCLAPLTVCRLPWGSDSIFPACQTDFSQLLVSCLIDCVYTAKKGAEDSFSTRELLQRDKAGSDKTKAEEFWASWGLSSQYIHYWFIRNGNMLITRIQFHL